jgi:hypothetical protein
LVSCTALECNHEPRNSLLSPSLPVFSNCPFLEAYTSTPNKSPNVEVPFEFENKINGNFVKDERH